MADFLYDQGACSRAPGSYGKRGSVSQNGCGAIAAYNACLLLGRPASFSSVLEALGKSALFGGKMGSSPFALGRYLRRAGIRTRFYTRSRSVQAHRAYAALYFFRKGCGLCGHYIALCPQAGGFAAYNDGSCGGPVFYPTFADIKTAHKALSLWVWGLE